MLKRTMKRYFAFLMMASLSLSSILALNMKNKAIETDTEFDYHNTAITSCWTGFCGHKSTTYSYPGYTTVSTGTLYRSMGIYLEPNASQTVGVEASYTGTVSAGLEVGNDVVKGSLGVSSSLTLGINTSTTITNTASYRRYVHAGVAYSNRRNTITKGSRTYNPAWDALGINNYCTYQYTSTTSSGKVPTSIGISLLSSNRYDF